MMPVTGRGRAGRRAAFIVVIGGLLLAAIGADVALAQSPFGVGPSGVHPAGPTGVAGWLLSKQAEFYRSLGATIRAAKTDGSAVLGLLGISFAYGIFHAAGPGHGKAVISSYLLANEETWRRGVVLSFASALLQAAVAVAIVAVAAAFLGATAKLMGDTVRVIETASYVLIVVVGARLLWAKGRAFVQALRQTRAGALALVPAGLPIALATEAAGPSHAVAAGFHDAHLREHHAHDHHHDHSHDHHHHDHGAQADAGHVHDEHCGHSHGPEPDQLAGPGGWWRGLSAIVAVGLRPCSGAILVLVFALAQGLFWAGIAATFVMGLGTALTVATIATFAVGAKGLARRFAGRSDGYGAVMLRGVEVAAAALVLCFGVLLLTGYMASERMFAV
jgi:ABC-type nickel/cobalt efflux system permease component RcnA